MIYLIICQRQVTGFRITKIEARTFPKKDVGILVKIF